MDRFTMSQSWIPVGSQSDVNLRGPNSSSDPLIEGTSGVTGTGTGGFDTDGLGINVPQASFIPSKDYGPSPEGTPRADRPLLSSPGHYASPPQLHHFLPHGEASRGPTSTQAGFHSAAGPAAGTSAGAATGGADFSYNPLPQTTDFAIMGKPWDSVPSPDQGHGKPGVDNVFDVNMAAIDLGNQNRSGNMNPTADNDGIGGLGFVQEYTKIAHDCPSRSDVHMKRFSWFSVTVLFLSVYSTCLSSVWFGIAVARPTWSFVGSVPGAISITTATLLTTLFAKTIEMSFVTVFVTFLGQTLSRKAFSKIENGVTLAEMTMRNWVIQPGSLMTHGETIRYASMTALGLLTLLATLAATFYTTASDAMVSPKLMNGNWHTRTMTSYVRASYANPNFMKANCKTPIRGADEKDNAGENCLNVHYSGNSYHTMMEYMAEWEAINANGTNKDRTFTNRPRGQANLFPNTTLVSQWIETQYSNITENMRLYSRVVNNVTLAMPHPGLYFAATHPDNRIPQPKDLDRVGEYEIRGAVVSPTLNSLCVVMTPEELAPLVYTTWPNALNNDTGIPGQKIGYPGWQSSVFSDLRSPADYNRTAVDDIFRWGPAYGRTPPIFRMYPYDFNIIVNGSQGDSVYVFGKPGKDVKNFTLCQLRSWLSPNCSTRFSVSGTQGGHMEAHCEDPNDDDIFLRHFKDPIDTTTWRWGPRGDWRNAAEQLKLSINLDGGIFNNNASNARLLTLLAVKEGSLPTLLPTMAEALAVLYTSTLVTGSVDTTLDGNWDYPADRTEAGNGALGTPAPEQFRASVRTQGYMSNHADAWQGIFYPILAAVVLLNVLCFFFFVGQWRGYFLTDYTEPANLFGLAIMSPPSAQLKGCCGGGPRGRDLVVPWRVSGFPDYDEDGEGDDLCDNNKPPPGHRLSRTNTGGGLAAMAARSTVVGYNNGGYNAGGGGVGTGYSSPAASMVAGGGGRGGPGQYHFFFEEAMDTPWRGKWKGTRHGESPTMNTGGAQMANSYKRLSSRKSFM